MNEIAQDFSLKYKRKNKERLKKGTGKKENGNDKSAFVMKNCFDQSFTLLIWTVGKAQKQKRSQSSSFIEVTKCQKGARGLTSVISSLFLLNMNDTCVSFVFLKRQKC